MSNRIVLITGTRKGIGEELAKYYLAKGDIVIGCSRSVPEWKTSAQENYKHFQADVNDEKSVKPIFSYIRRTHGRLDALINNAGIASMNHSILTPMQSAERVLGTNTLGTFLFCREAAKVMKNHKSGRIVNFATVATPLKLEGEAIYAASKAAIVSLTQILAREYADFGITVNAVGPTPIKTDLIRGVPLEKMERLLARQAIRRYGVYEDVFNVVDFFLREQSDFITGQVIYLGGV
ncbi:MAG: SDR family oxidoreductase [Selenomonadaceae bacterium]|nr:SDR family oxidoreductase [Selenomonadaceae bacterium]